MRVALVSIQFNTKGGSERRTYQLARGLTGLGHEVEIFAGSVEDIDMDARVNVVPVSSGPSFMKVVSFTKNVGGMLASRRDIDVVHNQIRPFTDGIVTIGGGCHAEYIERSEKHLPQINPLHRVILGLEKERYKPGGCRAVITNSELAKAGLLKYYDYPEERVFVAYNGVDLERFHPVHASDEQNGLRTELGLGDGPVMLFLGTGFERKGLTTAVKALGSMKGESAGLKLLVAGGDDPGPYKKLARKLGVADRVIFAGAVSSPEMYYRAADIFVLPTLYDPFSNACLEAMASGLPVVTTNFNGIREIMRHGESGFLMDDPDDHTGLSVIIGMLLDGGIRSAVGAEARKAAEQMTWEKTTTKTIEVYEKVYP